MGDKVKYGVIGLGWFGEQHCDTLMGIPHVELMALCTRTPKRLKALGKKFYFTPMLVNHLQKFQ